MRRSSLFFVLPLAILAAFLVATSANSASASTSTKGTDRSGVFYIDPDTAVDGDTVTLSANFATSQSGKTVTFYKGDSDADGASFSSIGKTIKANASGNAYMKSYKLSGDQILWAKTSGGKETQLFTFMADGTSTGCSVSGTLSATPAIVTPHSTVTFFANFLTDQAGADVTFSTVADDATETPIAGSTDKADELGNRYFDYQVGDAGVPIKIRATTSNNKCTKSITITPEDIAPGTPTGSLTVNPTDVRVGEDGKLVANFSSSLKSLPVTFFHKVSGSPATWEGVGTATSNSSGDATLTHTFNAAETFFALTSTGVSSPQLTVTPLAINGIAAGQPQPGGKNVLFVVTDDRKTPSKKGVDDPGAAAWSTNGGSTVTDTYPLETLAVRGNTTAKLTKKPFKLKFIDKQKPFDTKANPMNKDKTWVLLANYNDHAFVRNFASEDLGQKLSTGLAWTPRSAYTELYVNGKYQGSYQLIQSIKIDDDRVPVSGTTGQVVEFDPFWATDGVPGMEGKGIYSALDYAWKDPDEFKTNDDGSTDPTGLTNGKISDLKKKIRNFEDVLYGKGVTTGSSGAINWATYKPSSPAKDWETYLDLNSAVDYYIVKEFTKDTDSDGYRSNYFYTNNVDPDKWGTEPALDEDGDPKTDKAGNVLTASDKFFMGPVWDFDRSAGARTDHHLPGLESPEGWYLRGNEPYHNTDATAWLAHITKDPRFITALKARWNGPVTPGSTQTVSDVVKEMSGGSAAGDGTDAVTRGEIALGGGDASLAPTIVSKDDALWGHKSDRLPARTKGYTTELAFVRQWYFDRWTWMNGQIQKSK